MRKTDAPDDKWLHYNLVLFVGKDEEVYKLAERLSQKTGNSIEEELRFALLFGCNPHMVRNLQFQLRRYGEEA
jgi:hypothetical protein